jgi:hypothetical protein
MRSRLLLLALATMLLILPGSPAQAIVDGVPDEGDHPFVGQLFFHVPDAVDSRFDSPGAWYACSGTLVDETTVITAGHCTYGVGLGGDSTTEDGGDGSGGNDVWFNIQEEPNFSDLPPSSTFVEEENGNDLRYDAWTEVLNDSGEWRRATAYTHPEYDNDAFYMHDAGVLELDKPVEGIKTFGALPGEGMLDEYAKGPKPLFTAVGYGLEKARPWGAFGGDTRRQATMKLIGIKGVYGLPDGVAAKFSSNNGKPHQGGTCFGDSGGPIFLEDTNIIVAVTSFGMDPNCASGGGGYRLDQADDLEFFGEYVED